MSTMTDSFREMGQVKLAALGVTAVLLIGFFVFLSLRISSPVLSPLYTGLSMEDSSKIVQELEKKNIPYELGVNGTQVMVPSEQVMRLRLEMAQLGVPESGKGVGYEVFDSSEPLGTSNFVLNLNKVRALEGELARTINTLAGVESSRVHLVIPKRDLFKKDEREPTASVALKTKGASKLEPSEIAAIRNLVATAVPGLKPTRITIVDNKGNLLARGSEDENDPQALASTAQEFRTGFENKMKGTIERLLEQSLGYGKIKAEVSAEIDFDRIVTNSEKFDPEGQVARSVQGIQENETSNDSDVKDNVSVGQNLPDAKGNQGGTKSQSNRSRTDETTNYEISKVVQNQVKETGTVKKLSVAVLVDGVYSPDANGDLAYKPRSAEELANIKKLVESSVGFDSARGDKVEVINMQFANAEQEAIDDSPFAWLQEDLDSIIQTLVLGGITVLVILLIIRPLVTRAIASSQEAQDEDEYEQSLLSGPNIVGELPDFSSSAEEDEDELISISRIKGGIKSSTFRKINDMIASHPDESLQVMRRWAFTQDE